MQVFPLVLHSTFVNLWNWKRFIWRENSQKIKKHKHPDELPWPSLVAWSRMQLKARFFSFCKSQSIEWNLEYPNISEIYFNWDFLGNPFKSANCDKLLSKTSHILLRLNCKIFCKLKEILGSHWSAWRGERSFINQSVLLLNLNCYQQH